ncbi:MAG: hypothetical protein QM528_04500 [Phycisphaerales bacterium]|nr:hypothetical protein [Phycisphaerales bacterium]
MIKSDYGHLKNIGAALLFILLFLGVVLIIKLFMNKKNKFCTAVHITVLPLKNGTKIVDERNIFKLIHTKQKLEGNLLDSIKLGDINVQIMKAYPWVYKVNTFFKRRGVLEAVIYPREVYAKVLATDGTIGYVDSTFFVLPTLPNVFFEIPLINNVRIAPNHFMSMQPVTKQNCKLLLAAIEQNDFWRAQITQIEVDTNNEFVLYPLLGNHKIIFGDVSNIDDKLNRLYSFYDKVLPRVGINYYRVINLSFNHQIVAEKQQLKGDEPTVDKIHQQKMIQKWSDKIIFLPKKRRTSHKPQLKKII